MPTAPQLPEGVSSYIHDVITSEGFTYRVDYRHDLVDIHDDPSGRIQIRVESTPKAAHVKRLAEAIRAGAKIDLPAITEDEYVVFGNHRLPAWRSLGTPTVPVIIINAFAETADEDVTNRLRMVGFRENSRHGLPNSPQTQELATVVFRQQGWDNARIARELGIKPGRIADIVAVDKGDKVLADLGFGHLAPLKTVRAQIGRVSEDLNRAPLAELVKLAMDADLDPKAIRALATEAKEAGSDVDAVAVITAERKSRRTQVAGTATGGRPSYAAQLRQKMGFINSKAGNEQLLVEISPAHASEHLQQVEQAIAVLTAVRDLMVADGVIAA